jgi:hypothetical protein
MKTAAYCRVRYSAPSATPKPATPHPGPHMTHRTPTAAPEAPPLPLRGEGLGVGGARLQKETK